MTQEKTTITDGNPITLERGPSVMDMMLSLFGDKTVVFKSAQQTFYVDVSGLRLVDKEGSCWAVEAAFRLDPKEGRSGKCHIRFWASIRKGVLTEREIDAGKRFSVEHLNTLSEDDLQKEIARWQKFAVHSKESVQEYAVDLNDHDRLVVEARLYQILATAGLHATFEHKLLQYSRLRKAADASEELCRR